MKTQAALAREIAEKAHEGQYRRDGVTPYFTHPLAVAGLVEGFGERAVAVALLHDVLEDTSVTEADLRNAGVVPEVIEAVVLLTKLNTDDYTRDYLPRIRLCELARVVKLADLAHNLSDRPTENQVKKYSEACRFLEESVT